MCGLGAGVAGNVLATPALLDGPLGVAGPNHGQMVRAASRRWEVAVPGPLGVAGNVLVSQTLPRSYSPAVAGRELVGQPLPARVVGQ